MSRSAAVAYYLPELDDEPFRHSNTEQIRLLGFRETEKRATTRYGTLRPLPAVRETGYELTDREEAPFAGYYATEHNTSRQRDRKSVSSQWLAVAVGLLLVASTGYGVMNAVPARGQTLMLSGYRDLSGHAVITSQTSGNVAAPVIDATTGAGPAPVEPQPAPSQPNAYSLLGPPSLSAQQIEVVLRQYGSPAVGLGQKLFDLGVKYGIDPAYALAFFVHESGCGTKGVARFSKSVGNIRWTEGYGNYEGYRSYPTWESGMEDWYKLITDLYIGGWGLRTVDAIIPVYAPWGDDNHPPTYIASVKAMVDSWRGK